MPSSSLNKIRRFYDMKKAAGAKVQPYELEAAYGAEFDSANKQGLANRSLDMTEAQNAENNRLRAEELDANKSSASKSAITGLATNAMLLNYMMKDANVYDATGKLVSQGQTPAGKLIDWGSDKMFPSKTPSAVQPPTSGVTPNDPFPFQRQPVDTAADYSGDTVTGNALAPETTKGDSFLGTYALPVATGFGGEVVSNKTGLGEWISEQAPIGGSKDWNRAIGAGSSAGMALATGSNPWVAAGTYLATSIGLDSLFG
jgi:hypothetical protein